MSAEKVAKAFVTQDVGQMKSGNIHFDGIVLQSYAKVIAVRWPHFVTVTSNYHSRTTSNHKRIVAATARALGVPVVEVYYVRCEDDAQHKYNVERLRQSLQYAKQLANYDSYQPYKDAVTRAEEALALYEEKFDLKQEVPA
jgi:hypothetical protein